MADEIEPECQEGDIAKRKESEDGEIVIVPISSRGHYPDEPHYYEIGPNVYFDGAQMRELGLEGFKKIIR